MTMPDQSSDENGEMGDRIRVFLLDDHEIVRRGVADLIDVEEDMVVIGQWGGAGGAVERIEADMPDVVVIDERARHRFE
jgi:DNA-binding NarL/FixJ family response regulator